MTSLPVETYRLTSSRKELTTCCSFSLVRLFINVYSSSCWFAVFQGIWMYMDVGLSFATCSDTFVFLLPVTPCATFRVFGASGGPVRAARASLRTGLLALLETRSYELFPVPSASSNSRWSNLRSWIVWILSSFLLLCCRVCRRLVTWPFGLP